MQRRKPPFDAGWWHVRAGAGFGGAWRASTRASISDQQTPRPSALECSIGSIATGTPYSRRNQAETAMARYKRLIGPKPRARSLPAQRGEAAIAMAVLNTMIGTAKPVSVRVA